MLPSNEKGRRDFDTTPIVRFLPLFSRESLGFASLKLLNSENIRPRKENTESKTSNTRMIKTVGFIFEKRFARMETRNFPKSAKSFWIQPSHFVQETLKETMDRS